VAPLAGRNGVRAIVVDNASPDRLTTTVRDCVTIVELLSRGSNGGFTAAGGGSAPCSSSSPDSRLEPQREEILAVLSAIRRLGPAPRIVARR